MYILLYVNDECQNVMTSAVLWYLVSAEYLKGTMSETIYGIFSAYCTITLVKLTNYKGEHSTMKPRSFLL